MASPLLIKPRASRDVVDVQGAQLSADLQFGQAVVVVNLARVTGTPTATSVPVPVFVRNHNSAVTFGQLLISSTFSGQAQVPPVSPYLAGG
jgi:hypothetical protein